jgi:hypothetical protein
MSQIVRIRVTKTNIFEKEYLLRALEDLNYSYREGKFEIRAGGQRVPVEIKAAPKSLLRKGWGLIGLSQEIGFRRADLTYAIVGVSDFGREQFLQKLTQRYVYHTARAKIEEQGFDLVGEEVQEGERIHLVLRRMV